MASYGEGEKDQDRCMLILFIYIIVKTANKIALLTMLVITSNSIKEKKKT